VDWLFNRLHRSDCCSLTSVAAIVRDDINDCGASKEEMLERGIEAALA
jgi:hypothetical protein